MICYFFKRANTQIECLNIFKYEGGHHASEIEESDHRPL